MVEQTLLKILSRLVRQIFDDVGHGWSSDATQEIAGRVAEGAWNALIVLIRQAIASNRAVPLEGLGVFSIEDNRSFRFEPAASLIAAIATSRDADLLRDDAETRAQEVLFYLREGLKLLRTVPADISLLPAHSVESELPLTEEGGRPETLIAAIAEIRKQLWEATERFKGGAGRDEFGSMRREYTIVGNEIDEDLFRRYREGRLKYAAKAAADKPRSSSGSEGTSV